MISLAWVMTLVLTILDTNTFEEVARVEIGANPQKLAVDPDGSTLYMIETNESTLAVIDTESWEVIERNPLEANPTGIFLRAKA